MRLVMSAVLVGVLIAGLAASCTTAEPIVTSPSDNGPAPGSLDGTWVLVQGSHEGNALPMPADALIDMRIDGAMVGGTAACNSWFGEVAIGERSMSFSGVGQTEMACEEDRMAAERAYLAALADVAAFEVAADTLTLRGPGVELVFSRQAPVADADLVGTTWLLDSIVEGDAVSSTVGADAHLVFGVDGSLTGSTGCRTFGGTWATDGGGQLVISDVASDGQACPGELARQDQNMLETLSGRVRADVDGNRLTITAPDGTGLSFRAS